MAGNKPFILKKRNAPKVKLPMGTGLGFSNTEIRDADVVKVFAESALLYVREEAKRASYVKGVPDTLRTLGFQQALGYELITNKRGKMSFKITVEYNEKWKWVYDYLNSHDQDYAMRELTHERLAKKQPNRKRAVVPITDKYGNVNFRTAPLKIRDAWVHPAIVKWTWLERGIEKGIDRAMPEAVRVAQRKQREKTLNK
jgi:hypothetical protein